MAGEGQVSIELACPIPIQRKYRHAIWLLREYLHKVYEPTYNKEEVITGGEPFVEMG